MNFVSSKTLNTPINILKIAFVFIIIIAITIYSINLTPKVFTFDSGMIGKTICLISGTHGNEPSGPNALDYFIERLRTQASDTNIRKKIINKGIIKIIPRVNRFGLYFNTRYNLSIFPDINRNYSDNGREYISKFILQQITDADLVIDFHDGWGYHTDNKGSIGSTLSPTNFNSTISLSEDVVTIVNKKITEERKKFVVLKGKSCDISSSLSCHCQKNNKEYILVETSGQNNLQPLDITSRQVLDIVDVVISKLL